MDKNSQILDTARRLFSQFGLRKVTTDDIAKDAHVSKATIYRRYKNKREIFDEVVRIEADQLMSAIAEAVDRESTVIGKFRAHLLTKIGKLRELVNLYHVTRDTWQDHWPSGSHLHDWVLTRERGIVRGILEMGIRNGELQVKDIEFTAYLLVVSLQSVEYPWAFEGYDITLPGYVDRMLEILLNGIKTR